MENNEMNVDRAKFYLKLAVAEMITAGNWQDKGAEEIERLVGKMVNAKLPKIVGDKSPKEIRQSAFAGLDQSALDGVKEYLNAGFDKRQHFIDEPYPPVEK